MASATVFVAGAVLCGFGVWLSGCDLGCAKMKMRKNVDWSHVYFKFCQKHEHQICSSHVILAFSYKHELICKKSHVIFKILLLHDCKVRFFQLFLFYMTLCPFKSHVYSKKSL